MKTDKLKPYTRLKPHVLAVQVLPGIEDNWIATDDAGHELSRASTIESVQSAAPNAADYSPVLDLNGIEGKPLKMGDYVIDDGDGVYFVMGKDEFEELFAEGELSDKDAAKEARKHKPAQGEGDKAEYKGQQLSIEELMQELKHRDDELEKANNKAQTQKTNFDGQLAAAKNNRPDPLERPHGGQTDLDPSQEPILIVEQTTAELEGGDTEDGRQAWIEQAVDSGKAQGVTHARVSISENGDKLLYEGWLNRPEDQGHVRWGQPTNPTSASAGDNPAKEHEHDADFSAAGPDQLDPANSGQNGGTEEEGKAAGQNSSDSGGNSSTSASGPKTKPKKDPLDHDENGRKGGSRAKPKAKSTK